MKLIVNEKGISIIGRTRYGGERVTYEGESMRKTEALFIEKIRNLPTLSDSELFELKMKLMREMQILSEQRKISTGVWNEAVRILFPEK